MITPLDYRSSNPPPAIALAFYAHFGVAMDLPRATVSDGCCSTCVPSHSSPVADWRCGCDYEYADRDYDTFDFPFAIRIDRPNRRFSP